VLQHVQQAMAMLANDAARKARVSTSSSGDLNAEEKKLVLLLRKMLESLPSHLMKAVVADFKDSPVRFEVTKRDRAGGVKSFTAK
jgi:hypothetical protein